MWPRNVVFNVTYSCINATLYPAWMWLCTSPKCDLIPPYECDLLPLNVWPYTVIWMWSYNTVRMWLIPLNVTLCRCMKATLYRRMNVTLYRRMHVTSYRWMNVTYTAGWMWPYTDILMVPYTTIWMWPYTDGWMWPYTAASSTERQFQTFLYHDILIRLRHTKLGRAVSQKQTTAFVKGHIQEKWVPYAFLDDASVLHPLVTEHCSFGKGEIQMLDPLSGGPRYD